MQPAVYFFLMYYSIFAAFWRAGPPFPPFPPISLKPVTMWYRGSAADFSSIRATQYAHKTTAKHAARWGGRSSSICLPNGYTFARPAVHTQQTMMRLCQRCVKNAALLDAWGWVQQRVETQQLGPLSSCSPAKNVACAAPRTRRLSKADVGGHTSSTTCECGSAGHTGRQWVVSVHRQLTNTYCVSPLPFCFLCRVNVSLGPKEDRMLITGLHTVRDLGRTGICSTG